MNEELKTIFGEEVTVDGSAVPTAHLKYKGKEIPYVVWKINSDEPALSGDNQPLYSIIAVDVDVFSKGNYKSILKEIKKIMIANEWIWTGDSPEMYEDDTGLYHITASFEKERALWLE